MTKRARPFYALLVYALAAVVLTWPLAVSLTTSLGALQGPGDPFLNLWILGWGMHAWTTDPIGVLTGRAFDANIFYPVPDTLTYSDHFLLQALPLSPVYAATGNVVLCYNLLLLASIALSGLAMHAWVKRVTGSTAGAYLAGLAWACWPYRTAHLLHIQLQALYFLPLVLLVLQRVMAGRRARDAVLLGVLAALQAIASVYYGVMTMMALAVSALVLAVATGQWRSRRLAGCLALAAVVGTLLVLPVLVPYQRSQQAQGFGRTLYDAGNHSAVLRSYLQVPPTNLLYGATGLLAPEAPTAGEADHSGVEHWLFPGVVVVLFAAFGVVTGWRSDKRPLVMAGVALVVTGSVLSLGPDGVRVVYAWLYDTVYGFHAIRAPARFAVVAMLGLAPLAALGLAAVLARLPPHRRRTAAALVIALMAAEYVNVPLALAAAPPLRTETGQWLHDEPAPGAVLYLPLTVDIANTPFMVESLQHWRPIVNGYSGQRPAFYPALVDALSDLPAAGALAALETIDVRFVVSPTPLAGAGAPGSPLVERARFEDALIYEVRWTEAARQAVEAAVVPVEAPPPGPAPFADGEQLVYDVWWDGAGMAIPAGRATLTARRVTDAGAAWSLQAVAETADWVSPFFEARDTFATLADDGLLPLVHDRAIREGRRSRDRVFLYDADAKRVTTGGTRADAGAEGALGFPLAPGARDAVTAFYYARTLAAAGRRGTVQIPVNEAGRALILELTVGGEEQVLYRGQQVAALRLTPVLRQRLERRRPPEIVVWLRAGGDYAPLVVTVAAGFGSVRAELAATK